MVSIKKKIMNTKSTPILWIAPNLNHYKRRFLARLDEKSDFEVNIFSGSSPISEGHRDARVMDNLQITTVDVSKKYFAFHPNVFLSLVNLLLKKPFSIIMLPCERKHYPLLLWLVVLRLFFDFRLITYTHPVMRSTVSRKPLSKDIRRTKFIFRFFDEVIFYSKSAMDWAIEQRLIEKCRAHFANNTVDTDLIWSLYEYDINDKRPIRIIFIGRLTKSKRLKDLIRCTTAVRKVFKDLELVIIGDGPERAYIKYCVSQYDWVRWLGALVEEKDIAVQMNLAHAVFVPGWSGLSIVHSFAYGKPYFTFDQPHSTEIAYLSDDINGLLLRGNSADNAKRIVSVFSNPEKYEMMCNNALLTANEMSVGNWCLQVTEALSKTLRRPADG